MCGEGGEYETSTLSAPFFTSRITLISSKLISHMEGVWYLNSIRGNLIPCGAEVGWKEKMLNITERCMMVHGVNGSVKIYQNDDDCQDSEEDEELEYFPKWDHVRNELGSANLSNLSISNNKVTNTLQKSQRIEGFKKSGDFLYISGLCPPQCTSLQKQCHEIFASLIHTLNNHNLSLSSIVLVTVYISDMSQFPLLNEVYGTYFGINPPTRVTVQTSLIDGVQMDFLSSFEELRHLHVQGLSYWAPANIGPYSQTVGSGEVVFLAGMIGLVPATMELASKETQSLQALQSLERVVKTEGNMGDIMMGVCYLIGEEDGERAHWGERTGIPCLVVRVGGLPKGACVEWQAALFSKNGWRGEGRIPDRIWATEKRGSGWVTTVSRSHSRFFVGAVRDFEGMREGLGEVCWDDVVFLRVFYRLDIDRARLISGVEEIIGSISVTFVAVVSVDDDSTFMLGFSGFSIY